MIPHTTIWAMDQPRLLAMHRDLALKSALWPTPAQLNEARELAAKSLKRISGRVAIMPIHGIIEHRMSAYGYMYGGTSTEQCEQVLDALLANRDIEAIVMDFDSPGGISYGTEEFSDKVFASRGKKPIYAIANSQANSAACWIATAADQFYVTPGGDTASIGVYQLHADFSEQLKLDGVKVEFIRAGKYKAEFNPYEPLTQDARDHAQELVDETYGKFVKAVARNRGTKPKDVLDNYGQGRVLSADQAVSVGLADKVMTMGQLLEKLTGSASLAGEPQEGSRYNMQMMRLRHEQDKRKLESTSTTPPKPQPPKTILLREGEYPRRKREVAK